MVFPFLFLFFRWEVFTRFRQGHKNSVQHTDLVGPFCDPLCRAGTKIANRLRLSKPHMWGYHSTASTNTHESGLGIGHSWFVTWSKLECEAYSSENGSRNGLLCRNLSNTVMSTPVIVGNPLQAHFTAAMLANGAHCWPTLQGRRDSRACRFAGEPPLVG